MKKLIFCLIILTVFVNGCQHIEDDEFQTSDFDFPNISQKETANMTEKNTSIESTITQKNDAAIYFEDRGFALDQYQQVDINADYLEPPKTYSELMSKLETFNGIIVSGYAFGTRKGYHNEIMQPKTETSFRVEQVYFGEVDLKTITILEKYCPLSDAKDATIEYEGPQYSILKNDQKVLMFLRPASKAGVYFPTYYEIPLPDDYQNYDETAQKELLDFYRGNEAVYQEQYRNITPRVEKEVIELPGGAVEERYVLIESPCWPKQDISDEALLEEMSDHILVRLATDYKIKIWPEKHIRFTSTQDRLSKKGIQELSLPDDSVAKS